MQKNTKQYIIDEATKVFNRDGFGKVSLQDLARELNMSRGNLAYHFPNKDVLLAAIFDQMWTAIDSERQNARTFPSFQNLRKEVQLYAHYQRTYAFIFTDSQVMAIPVIQESLRKMTLATIRDNEAAIAFAIKLGNMRPEPFPGAYHQVAVATWMTMFYWLPQQILRGDLPDEAAEKAVWCLILPHFTERGIQAFKEFHGIDFFNSLGPALEIDPEDIVVL